jgi:hypothetical protein
MTLEDALKAGRHFLHYEEPFDRDFVVLETTRGWLLYEEAIDRKALIGGGAMLFVSKKSGKARYYGGGELEYVTYDEPGYFSKVYLAVMRCLVHGNLTGLMRLPDRPGEYGPTIVNIFDLKRELEQ